MERKLYTIQEAEKIIQSGKIMVITGDESALDKLPEGNWIGGTIPYFMDIDKGKENREMVFIEDQSNLAIDFNIKIFDVENQDNVAIDGFDNGYTIVIVPANSNSHIDFAINSFSYTNIFNNPIIGYISGTHLDDVESSKARIVNGQTKEKKEDGLIALNIKLPENKVGRIEIANIFEQNDQSDEIRFPENGFTQRTCLVNGVEKNFSDYLSEINHDLRFPLIVNQNGALINKSFKSIDEENKDVTFYAPLFKHETYRFAKHLHNYGDRFKNILPKELKTNFACNCILNYLYGDFATQKYDLTYATTFGEIGYQLLNQTLVYLIVDEI